MPAYTVLVLSESERSDIARNEQNQRGGRREKSKFRTDRKSLPRRYASRESFRRTRVASSTVYERE